MTGPIRCVVIAGLLNAGCGDDASTPGGDASIGGGLVVHWTSTPADWPADLGAGLTLEHATFAVDNLRVVGDAAPGDPRTAKSAFDVTWDGATLPGDLAFPDAPGGLYSQLSLLIDGRVAGPSIEWRGHVRLGATDYAYRITDDSAFALTLATGATLRPPSATTLGLRIDFKHVLDAIDFAMLGMTGGTVELDDADPQIAVFRAKLREAIEVVN